MTYDAKELEQYPEIMNKEQLRKACHSLTTTLHQFSCDLILYFFRGERDLYPFQRIRIDTSLIVEIRAKQLPVANAEQYIKECCNVIRIYTLFYGYSCHVIRCCAKNI